MKNFGHENEHKAFILDLDELDYGCQSIVAILNMSNSGELYIGVNKDGNVVGVNSYNASVSQNIFETIQKSITPLIYPSIFYDSANNVIIVSFSGDSKPYSYKRDFYIRSYDENREMDYDSIMNEIRFLNQNIFYEESRSSETPRDVNETIIKDIYARASTKKKFRTIRYTLKTLNLMQESNLNLAGRYLFSKKNPLDIQINVYADEQKRKVLKTTLIKGNIFELIDKSTQLIDSEQVKNKSSKRLMEELLKETLTFSFLNGSFNKKEPYIIQITPYEISYKFPGTLFFLNSLEEYYEGNYKIPTKNKIIGRVFNFAGLTNTTEKSLKKIEKICKDNSIIFSSSTTGNGITISYVRYSHKEKEVTLEQAILSILSTRPMIKADLLAKKLNRTRRTIQTSIKKLKESNLITRKGSNKNGYWIVNK